MCSPGIYNLLMNNVPEEERSQASAVQNLAGALCQAGTAALTGACIAAYGYHIVMFADAAIAISASLLFFILGRRIQQPFRAAENTLFGSADLQMQRQVTE
jgi:sugar phosphate permease